MMKILGVIPSRYASTRLPGKPLELINGKPMIQWVYEQAKKSQALHQIVVATDDERIFNTVVGFGGQVMMTSSLHKNGTERCAEVISKFKEYKHYDYVVNVQGDEPFIKPEQIDELCAILEDHIELGTLVKQIDNVESLLSDSVMKVVFNSNNEALYFSRTAIPFIRDRDPKDWLSLHSFYKHIGIYAYRRDVLLKVSQLSTSPLEKAESLEQLRWLENGYKITIAQTRYESTGIDTPADLDAANSTSGK